MANGYDSFLMSIDQENRTVPPPPRETPTATPPPPRETNIAEDKNQSLINSLRSTSLTPQETETCLQSLTNVMTSTEDEDDALFQEVITKLNGIELQRTASLLTSNSDHYFLEIARTRNGSNRIRTLFGKSDDADTFFFASILRHFFHVMTDKDACYAAIHGMRVFNQDKKMTMYDQILHHAVPLACDRYGSITIRAIISDTEFVYCRHHLLGIVSVNALLLSYDVYGNYVVQHVLKQNDLHCTYNIAVSLHGHYVELSFEKNGRYIVEKLLERAESGVLVVAELLECGGDRLVRLSKSVHGHFVVETALKVTREDLLRALVNKLLPFLGLLRSSHHANAIAGILESVR